MSVFTIYCHGTNSHRSRTDGEIVTEFSKRTPSPSCYILDGPGSGGTSDEERKKNPTPGFYNPYSDRENKILKSDRGEALRAMELEAQRLAASTTHSRYRVPGAGESFEDLTRRQAIQREQGVDISTPAGRRKFAEHAIGGMGWGQAPGYKPGGLKKVPTAFVSKGTGTGYGWDDNIAEAIAVIFDRMDPTSNKHIPRLTTLNLMGWSRGAVTCLRIANKLDEIMMTGSVNGGLRVNIFAVDPVAGWDAGLKLKDTKEVPGIVKNYIATLAMDERRGAFAPQDKERVEVLHPSQTNYAFLPFPGNHSTQVRKGGPEEVSAVADVVWDLAFEFLQKHGTEFYGGFSELLSPPDLLTRYSGIRSHRQDYFALRSHGLKEALQGGFSARTFTGMNQSPQRVRECLDKYVPDSDYFVNAHHRALFKRQFPTVFRWAFDHPKSEQESWVSCNSAVGEEIAKLRLSSLETSQWFDPLITRCERPNGAKGDYGFILNYRKPSEADATTQLMIGAMLRMGFQL